MKMIRDVVNLMTIVNSRDESTFHNAMSIYLSIIYDVTLKLKILIDSKFFVFATSNHGDTDNVVIEI